MSIRPSSCRLFVILTFSIHSLSSFGNPLKFCNETLARVESAAIRTAIKWAYPGAYVMIYGREKTPVRPPQPQRPTEIDSSVGGFTEHASMDLPSQNKIALSQDGQWLATEDSNAITILNTTVPDQIRSIYFNDGNRSIDTMTFSPDGKHLVVASTSLSKPKRSISEISVWDLKNGKLLKQIGNLKNPPIKLSVNPEGTRLGVLYFGVNDAEIWDLSPSFTNTLKSALGREKPLASFEARPYAIDLAFTSSLNNNPNALSTLSLNEGTLSHWDYKTGTLLSENPNNGNSSMIHQSNDGKVGVLSSTLGLLNVRDPKSGERESLLGGLNQGESGRSALMSADGGILILRTYPDTVRIFKR